MRRVRMILVTAVMLAVVGVRGDEGRHTTVSSEHGHRQHKSLSSHPPVLEVRPGVATLIKYQHLKKVG